MNKKLFAMALAFIMIFSIIFTTSASAALIPPQNYQRLILRESKERNFATEGFWESWVDEGNPVVEVLENGGPNGEGALRFSSGGAKGMVLNDSKFSNLSGFDEISFSIKSTQMFTIKFALRDQTLPAEQQDIGTSRTVLIEPTNGEWKTVKIARSEFYGGVLTNDQIDKLRTIYDLEASAYKPVIFMFLGSQEATISNFKVLWYDKIEPILKSDMTNFNDGKKPDVWGSWNGTTSAVVDGMAEDGVGKALHITGGADGGGTQLAFVAGSFQNFIGLDAWRLRVKSTSSFKVGIWLEYRASKSPTKKSKNYSIPSTNGEWKDVYVPISGIKPDEDGDWIHNIKGGYTTNFEPVVLMRIEQTNFGTTKYATIGEIEAIWYDKLPTMQSISFTNNGQNSDYGLMEGTTDVNVQINNPNVDKDFNNMLLIAAMYRKSTGELVDIDTELISVSKGQTTPVNTVSVTMPDDALLDYEIKVMLWQDKDNLNQITEVMTFDAYGASGQQ